MVAASIGLGADTTSWSSSSARPRYYGPREKWPAYLTYRPDERLFFNAYTFEQVEAFVKANPSRWMANPYSGDGTAITLEHDLHRLHATGAAIGYLAYGAHVDGQLPRIEGTSYFYRDGLELTDEREEDRSRPISLFREVGSGHVCASLGAISRQPFHPQ